MKYATRTALALGLTSLGLVSCEKTDLEPADASTSSTSGLQILSESLDDQSTSYLASLSATLTHIVNVNPEAKYVLGQLAQQQFDGDYDVAFKHLLETHVGGVTFADLLTKEGFQTDPLAAGLTQAQANRVIVAIPVEIENWDNSARVQGTFIPVGVSDAELQQITVFDAEGHTSAFTPNLKPMAKQEESFATAEVLQQETPFIVASLGERLDDSGNVRVEFTHEYQTRLREQQESMAKTAARGGGRAEYLRGIKCDRLGTYEPAIRGKPEFRLYAASSYNNSFSTGSPVVMPYKIQDGTLFTGDRKRFDYGFDPNVLLFTWNTNFSDFYTVKWLEEDGGPTIKLTLDASYTKGGIKFGGSTTIDFSRWEDDDVVGELPVNIQDANWRYYTFSYYNSNPLFLTTMESR